MLKSQLVDHNGRAIGTHPVTGVGSALVTANHPHSEFYFEAEKGNIPGVELQQKFCANENIDKANNEIIWLSPSTPSTYTFPLVPEVVDVVSSSGTDVSGSTGAAEVTIYGLDGDYREISEVIALNGAGAVSSTLKYMRIYRMKCTGEVGSYGSNEGNLTLDGNVTSNVYAYIPIGYGQTQLGVYTVPAKHTAFIVVGSGGINADLSGAAGVRAGEIQIWIRLINELNTVEAWRMLRRFNLRNDGTSNVTNLFGTPLTMPEKCDIKIIGNTQTNGTAFYFEWHMLVVENELL